MAITSPPYIINPSFEDGTLTGWTLAGSGSAVSGSIDSSGANASSGGYSVRFQRTTSGNDFSNAKWEVRASDVLPVYPGQAINVSCDIKPTGASDEVGGQVAIAFTSADGTRAEFRGGSQISVHQGQNYRTSTLNTTAPDWAATATILAAGWIVRASGVVWVDNFRTNYTFNRSLTLSSPLSGTTYPFDATVPLRVTVGGAGGTVTAVRYYYTNGVDPKILIGAGTAPDWGLNTDAIPAGTWTISAEMDVAGVVVQSNQAVITVGSVPPPITREYKASNSYTYLIGESFSGLSENMPSTAKVTGVEFDIDYMMQILSRTKDLGVADPYNSTDTAPFDITNGGVVEIVMLRKQGDGYELIGAPERYQIPIDEDDFSIVETGLSEGKEWVVRHMDDLANLQTGEEDFLWSQSPIDASDFRDVAFGFRFYPELGAKPAYADSGDACFRFFLDKLRIRVYFDAGSVEYYFVSPDYGSVIKGTLVSANTLDGDLSTGDASGVLQLDSELEVIDGSQVWIGNDWTIHASYPPTAANKIGDVGDVIGEDVVGMEYNGLPTQKQVRDNRSRYQMITANFYGDKALNSIYGANGYDRAFAYNGKWFYKIYTQPDALKDRPRHVAYHHWHLALGYDEGRVDISVVGEPYNFDGSLGASSWTIGDQVVGLLPLSGTILGVFGSKSVWGISGTTVDNFATQVISPNIGATEYTICDMGSPIYANAYGIYTLAQTQEYGDYMGVPMSQDISPWLRPRLVRKYTTTREVEVAWPVRSKNQYRLAFSDGYVLSMTMNGQAVPTFSKQKYFLGEVCTPGWQRLGEYGVETGPAGGGWNVTLDKPSRIRITNTEYWVSPNASWSNGFILETTNGTIDIENEAGQFTEQFLPMPIEYDDVTAIYYTGAEDNSDATVENSSYLVEVWRDCEGDALPTNLYEYPAIVPAAVSSQLDVTGEERIHIAPWIEEPLPPPPPVATLEISPVYLTGGS